MELIPNTHIFSVLEWSVVQLVLCVGAGDVPQCVHAASLERPALEALACSPRSVVPRQTMA